MFALERQSREESTKAIMMLLILHLALAVTEIQTTRISSSVFVDKSHVMWSHLPGVLQFALLEVQWQLQPQSKLSWFLLRYSTSKHYEL